MGDLASSIRRVLVLGTGTMGEGIAQVTAAAGCITNLFDVDETRAKRAVDNIGKQTEKLVQKGKMTDVARADLVEALFPMSDLPVACSGVDLVIEAVPENMDLKVDVLSRVKDRALSHAIIASNTSSLSLTELGRRIGASERTVGLHFFNPPPVMELLEIVRGLGTSDATIEVCEAFAKRLKKTSILVRDVPGFATSRLGVILGAEAMRMLESGVASTTDIDRAMELGYRHPMGPLKLTDLVGLDVRLAILEHLHRELGEQFRPPSILRQMVRAGRLGKKVGIGFYKWTDAGPVAADSGAA
ncbi:MAG: 3-hydroxyacyl-CoA dehydrogenase family protein [Polyangiaceae bacterium]|nr:3-hydroxyacyl-CoA dehydrogenase family protein [Polyangiaceae bacterium]